MTIYEQLERDEGRKRFPYVDSVGKVTIGVGHNLTDKGLPDSIIDLLLKSDVADVDSGLVVLPWILGLSEARRGVLRNMAFNLGTHGVLGFRDTLGFMERGTWDAAATAMLDSQWAKQVGARAQRLATQLRTGEWQ